MSLSFFETMCRLLRAGRRVAVATVVGRQGSAPRARGARMIVTEEGGALFSVGGGSFEALVIEDARQALSGGAAGEKEYRFTEEGENAVGMVCGGTARVLIEVIEPPRRLLIFGGGHVGREVALLGSRLEFDVTVIDDRPAYLDASRYPAGVRTVRAEAGFAGGLPEIPPASFVAILTRCHRTDLEGVRHAVGKGAAFVGLIGSRRKVATVKRRALELGTAAGALVELRAPIGLPIGAETPEEIAVSILAEMIAVDRGAAAAGRPAARSEVVRLARRAAQSSKS